MDLIIICPSCGHQHVDKPELAAHLSHRCGNCWCVFRPADEPTLGVGKLRTRGPHDTDPPPKPFVWSATNCPENER